MTKQRISNPLIDVGIWLVTQLDYSLDVSWPSRDRLTPVACAGFPGDRPATTTQWGVFMHVPLLRRAYIFSKSAPIEQPLSAIPLKCPGRPFLCLIRRFGGCFETAFVREPGSIAGEGRYSSPFEAWGAT